MGGQPAGSWGPLVVDFGAAAGGSVFGVVAFRAVALGNNARAEPDVSTATGGGVAGFAEVVETGCVAAGGTAAGAGAAAGVVTTGGTAAGAGAAGTGVGGGWTATGVGGGELPAGAE